MCGGGDASTCGSGDPREAVNRGCRREIKTPVSAGETLEDRDQ